MKYFISCVLLFVTSVPQALGQNTVQEILQSLTETEQLLNDSHLTIAYHITTPAHLDADGEQLDEFAKLGQKCYRKKKSWQANLNDPSQSQWLESRHVFDGSRMASEDVRTVPNKPPQLQPISIVKSISVNKMFGANYYMDAIGGFLYEGKDMLPWHFCVEQPDESQPFNVLKALGTGQYSDSGIEEIVNNYPCRQLENPGFDRISFGKELNNAIVRRQWSRTTVRGHVVTIDINNLDFAEYQNRIWLPRRSEIKVSVNRAGASSIFTEGTYRLTSARFGSEVPTSLFEIYLTPGREILDASLLPQGETGTQALDYVVGVTPEQTQLNLNRALATQVVPVDRSFHWVRWANALALTFAVAIYLWIRRRKLFKQKESPKSSVTQ